MKSRKEANEELAFHRRAGVPFELGRLQALVGVVVLVVRTENQGQLA